VAIRTAISASTGAIAYGMTERSPVSFQSAIDDPLERRVSTIGRVQPHLEASALNDRSPLDAELG
jgi:fatty-acyl-CoA synthase